MMDDHRVAGLTVGQWPGWARAASVGIHSLLAMLLLDLWGLGLSPPSYATEKTVHMVIA